MEYKTTVLEKRRPRILPPAWYPKSPSMNLRVGLLQCSLALSSPSHLAVLISMRTGSDFEKDWIEEKFGIDNVYQRVPSLVLCKLPYQMTVPIVAHNLPRANDLSSSQKPGYGWF